MGLLRGPRRQCHGALRRHHGGRALNADQLPRGARAAFGFNAALAGIGFLLTLALSGLGLYALAEPTGHTYGIHPDGFLGAWSRMSDTVSYFTEWSNVVVAISLFLLWRNPTDGSYWKRVLRLDGLLMITVTAIVYAVLLAPTEVVTGWSRLTNPWQHIVVPAVTVLVFLIWGPRGWFNGRVVLGSLLLPIAWILWMLGRGLVVGAYPYAFVDPLSRGYGPAFATIGQILVFGVIIAVLFWGIDAALVRLTRKRA